MIPILFDKTEKQFQSNGLGRLSDAMSCTVTEERNGVYELEMTYPITGIHYSDISYDRIVFAVPADGKRPQPFEIYEVTRPMDGKVTVKAEHISYRMSYIPVMPCSAGNVGAALSALQNNAAENCPFSFWTDKETVASFKVTEPTSMRSLLGGMSGSIIDAYGGEWEFDVFTARLWKDRGSDNSVAIRYGKNLTDLKQEESIASVYTGIVPYWKGTTGEADSTEKVVTLPERAVYAETKNRYPFSRTIPVDLSSKFQSEPSIDRLRSAAQSYVRSNRIGYPKVSLTVSFVPLWQTEEYRNLSGIEHVNLCDTVHVFFPDLNISTTAKVVKTVYNVLTDRYDSIELGDAKATLSDSLQTFADEAKDAAASESRQYTDQTSGNFTVNIDEKLTKFYTKKETDEKISSIKSSASDSSNTYTDEKLKSYYTQTQVDKKFGSYYTKDEADERYLQEGAVDKKLTIYYTKTETDDKLTGLYTKEEAREVLEGMSTAISEKAGKDSLIAQINQSEEVGKIKADKVDLSGKMDLAGTFASSSAAGKEIKMQDGLLRGSSGQADFSETSESENKIVRLTSEGDMILSAMKLYVPGGYFDTDGFHKSENNTEDKGSADQEETGETNTNSTDAGKGES